MIFYKDALKTVQAVGQKIGRAREQDTEIVDLEYAVGRILAQKLRSPESIPAFDNSAMDGFAVRSEETMGASRDNPVSMRIVTSIAAGDRPLAISGDLVGKAVACEIMTGAPLPQGFDCAMKVEDVEVAVGPERFVRISEPIRCGENIRKAGDDFTRGAEVAEPGTVLRPEHVLVLAGLGIHSLRVKLKLSVVVISTGKELVEHSEKHLEPGQIRNSSGPYLKAALSEIGAETTMIRLETDDPSEFRQHLLRILQERRTDLVLTTGAVSMGRYDFVPEVLQELGATIHFHKVAMRPGKPVLFAEFPRSETVLFGLPGNPVSTAVGLRFFVVPFIRALRNLPPETPVLAKVDGNACKPEGLRCFFKARLGWKETSGYGGESGRELCVQVLPGQASFMVSPLLVANSWAVLPEDGSETASGSVVEVYPQALSLGQGFFGKEVLNG